MYIDIIEKTSSSKQIPSRLTALLKYLHYGKPARKDATWDGNTYRIHIHNKLAGAPRAYKLVQRYSPYGIDGFKACADLSHQLFAHARKSESSQGAKQTYKHILISMPVGPLDHSHPELSKVKYKKFQFSNYEVMLRISRETLNTMGIPEDAPLIIFVHRDKDFWHSHVVCGIFSAGLDLSPTCDKLPRKQRMNIAALYYPSKGIEHPNDALKKAYSKYLT